MAAILAFLHHYLGSDLRAAGFTIINLIVIESLLSVDNAAVLAGLVMDLPPAQRRSALRIGIVLAYIFRGTCLVFASVLIRISWLKLLGGAYLLYLFASSFYQKYKGKAESEAAAISRRKFNFLTPYISTVLMVEVMDLSFSIDNVFAAVAYTDNIVLVCTGVFIGIIAMRVVAGYFVVLMERFPFLDTVALIVIGLLGLKLCLSFAAQFMDPNIQQLIDGKAASLYFSLITAAIFFLPVIGSVLLSHLHRKPE